MSSIVYDKQPARWITWRGKHIPVDENGAIMKIQVKRQEYQDEKAKEKANKTSLNYANKNKKLMGKWEITEKDKEDLYKAREKSLEATRIYEDRMRARYEQEEDDRDFENAYHKVHKEKSVEAHNEYKSRSDRYAEKYGEEERMAMFNKSQESRRNEVSGRKLTKNLTPKERAREIDKANGKIEETNTKKNILIPNSLKEGFAIQKSSYNDESKMSFIATGKGNLELVYDGKRTGTIMKNLLSDETAMALRDDERLLTADEYYRKRIK